MNRYKFYETSILSRDLISKLNLKNSHQRPKLKKISVHLSLKDQNFESKKFLLPAFCGLELIGKQKPFLHHSNKGVATYKIQKGDLTGLSMQLRNKNMYDFMNNLLQTLKANESIHIGFNKEGHLSIKVNNLLSFPEIEKEYLHFQKSGTSSNKNNQRYLPLDINFSSTTATKTGSIRQGKVIRTKFAYQNEHFFKSFL